MKEQKPNGLLGPLVKFWAYEGPIMVIVLVVFGLVVGGVGTFYLHLIPNVIDPIVDTKVKQTLAAQPPPTPMPTYTPYPTSTHTPTPTGTPTPTPTPAVRRSEMISIKTFHNTYVTSMGDQQGLRWRLRAETRTPGNLEKFILLYLDNGKVALKTYQGRFVSATGNNGCCDWALIAENQDRGVAEEFALIDLGNGKVAFETYQGRYVTASDAGQCWMIRAEAKAIDNWEKFTIDKLP